MHVFTGVVMSFPQVFHGVSHCSRTLFSNIVRTLGGCGHYSIKGPWVYCDEQSVERRRADETWMSDDERRAPWMAAMNGLGSSDKEHEIGFRPLSS